MKKEKRTKKKRKKGRCVLGSTNECTERFGCSETVPSTGIFFIIDPFNQNIDFFFRTETSHFFKKTE
jgi:hypothetical protein